VPLVLAVLLRKHVRKIMIGALITVGVVLTVKMVMEVRELRENRAGPTAAPVAIAPAPRTPTPVEIQRALIDARSPETTSTPPQGQPVGEFEQVYCSGPPAERPDFCP
jgi:hypothetical protein